MQKTNVHAPEGQPCIFITREFDLPVALLFKAHAQAQLLAQWMGTNVIKLENKKHGSFQFETEHNGNVVFSAHGTIHDVVENKKIVRTFEMHNSDVGVQLEYLDFEELGKEKSKLSIQINFKSMEHRAAQLKRPFAYGLNSAHQRLQEIGNQLETN